MVPEWVWSHPAQLASARRAAWRAQQFMLNDECPGCGCLMHDGGEDDDQLCTVDHHIPRSADGPDEPWNWRLLCKGCNQEKADQVPAE